MTVPFRSFNFLAGLLVGLATFEALSAGAAEDLKLRDGISFDQDVDSGFPIEGKHIDDAALDSSAVNFIFFGASGDLNTNRQARRVVEAYRKFHSDPIKFLVIDVDQTRRSEVKHLLKSYYKGYIPFEVLVDKDGKTI